MKQFLMGSQIVVKAAVQAGAEAFFAYPITPASEIMSFWIQEINNKSVKSKKSVENQWLFLQTEDEMSAGFMTLGAILGGKIAFSATAGPGNVLMQDALSMAESMRIPIVVIIGQRGGPSTGTVVYSQQEVTLTAFGGNGEGCRIVYSPAGLQELYRYTKKSFSTAWKYRFPTFVLTDGYTTKLRGEVDIDEQSKNNKIKTSPFFTEDKNISNYRNCYEYEEEIYELNMSLKKDFEKYSKEIEEYEIYPAKALRQNKIDCLIIAHGIVGLSSQAAINGLRDKNIVLFRPITIWPFPGKVLRKMAQKAKKILVVESAANQLLKLVKESLYGLSTPIEHIGKPGLGIYPREIKKAVIKII